VYWTDPQEGKKENGPVDKHAGKTEARDHPSPHTQITKGEKGGGEECEEELVTVWIGKRGH